MTGDNRTPPDSQKLEIVIKEQLSKAYYNGLDKKGYSQWEEETAVKAILAAKATAHQEALERQDVESRLDEYQLGLMHGAMPETIGKSMATDHLAELKRHQERKEHHDR